jgi:hypothetical protein
MVSHSPRVTAVRGKDLRRRLNIAPVAKCYVRRLDCNLTCDFRRSASLVEQQDFGVFNGETDGHIVA